MKIRRRDTPGGIWSPPEACFGAKRLPEGWQMAVYSRLDTDQGAARNHIDITTGKMLTRTGKPPFIARLNLYTDFCCTNQVYELVYALTGLDWDEVKGFPNGTLFPYELIIRELLN